MTSADQTIDPTRATIYRLVGKTLGTAEHPPAIEPGADVITVQFNPNSLKLERSNDLSGSVVTQGQRRQQPNEGHSTLTLELIFDTVEGDANGQPLDVRNLTAQIRQFVEPPETDPTRAVPPLRFVWGSFCFDGLVTHLTEDLDYFSPEGMALRAKVTLSITSQNLKFEANASGPGSRKDTSSTRPDHPPASTGPGGRPSRNPSRTALAQAGESVQQLLGRLGADPSTWRSAMAGLDSPLTLTAGAELQVDGSVSAGAGIGVTAGFSAGLTGSAGLSAGASAGFAAGAGFGVGAGAGFAAGAGAGLSAGVSADVAVGGTVSASAEAAAGFSLSAQGGVAASAGQALAQQVGAAAAGARAAFDVPGGGLSVSAGLSVSGGLSASGTASASATAGVQAEADAGRVSRTSAAAAAATVDPRAAGYGRGVPLRPRPPATQA